MSTPTFRDAQRAFNEAIETNQLSDNPKSPRYAGKYMYMHTEGTTDFFKHVDTRAYIRVMQMQAILNLPRRSTAFEGGGE